MTRSTSLSRFTLLLTVHVLLGIVLMTPLPIHGQSLSDVPGVVVYHHPAPSPLTLLLRKAVYTTSPSIVVLRNGDYVISLNIFGPGSGADVSGTTEVFRSSDKGASWTHLVTLTDMKRGSLFVHDGDLYMIGYRNNSGDIVIRKSTDNGSTWTTPTDGTNGLLRVGKYGGTPNNPVLYEGRIYAAQSGRRILSAPADADLLRANSWTLSSTADTNSGPLGSGLTVTEAQIVASPKTGVVLLPKVGGHPNTVLIRAGAWPNTITQPTDADWVDLPGGEKKFGAAYDGVSEKFYVLSNPVLPAHRDGNPAMTRNTAAMLSSRDLYHWDVEKIFLYSPNVGYEAFQYLNFDFDGDDLVVASRTAFDVGGHKPPRGHDSNLITFHKIPDFRTATPEYLLVLEGGRVMRYEKTQHAPAPLGPFALGTTFDGTPLKKALAFGQDPQGHVYIREESGRILRFDALGNFIERVESAPVPLQSDPLLIAPPPYGERAWIHGGSGTWETLTNWFYWNRPDTDYEVANFGSAIGKDSTISMAADTTIKGIRFRSPHSYTIAGSGSISLSANGDRAVIEVLQGDHRIHVPVRLESDVDLYVAPGAALHFSGGLDLNQQTLFIDGAGTVEITGGLNRRGGAVIATEATHVVVSD